MRGVKPLPKAGRSPTPASKARATGRTKPAATKAEAAAGTKQGPATPPAAGRQAGDAAVPAGLDRRTATRLRRGQLTIDGRLDLHGHTQSEAHRALHGFVKGAARRGHRCLLVITGKGGLRTQANGDDGVERESGVLRRNVPRWLNEAPVRDLVLGVETARAQHGGAGAYYVLLRRQRQ